MIERFVGKNVEFSTDGGQTWDTLGTLGETLNCTATELVTRVAVDAVFPRGSFIVSGKLLIEGRNRHLEALIRCPIRSVEPTAARSPDSRPWLSRKKGRAGHGY